MWTIELAVMLLMIALNSVFAAYEISLASGGVGRLHSLVGEKKRGAEAAVRMKENIEGSLAVVQIGITLVGVIAAYRVCSCFGYDEQISAQSKTSILFLGVEESFDASRQ